MLDRALTSPYKPRNESSGNGMLRNIITYCSNGARGRGLNQGRRRASEQGPFGPFLFLQCDETTEGNVDMTREMTGAEMVIQALADQGVRAHLRLSGRRGAADL